MNIQEQLMIDLKDALRSKDELRKTTIRMALAALKNARVAKNADLTENEMAVVLRKQVKLFYDLAPYNTKSSAGIESFCHKNFI